MCVVQIEGKSKLQVSCNTRVEELPPERKMDGGYDMVVNTQTEVVKKARQDTLEFLLLNHPLDCPVCDQAGECYLQDYSFKYGSAHSRFKEEKRVRVNEYLGSKIVINHNRCILCTRCVRFTREISGTDELFIQNRGYYSKISVLRDKPLDNFLAGNVADICPVGALLSTDYIHKNRIWNLSIQSSICTECSVGCNINVYYQDNQIFRIDPRENHHVNGFFMCDIGRYGFHKYEEIKRVESPLIREADRFSEISWEGAMKEILEHFTKLKDGEKRVVAGIASPYFTNETNYMFGRLINNVLKGRGIVGALQSSNFKEDESFPSGFRISGDRSPNRRGMQDLCQNLVEDIFATIKRRRIKLLYVLDDCVNTQFDEHWRDILRHIDFIVVQTYAMSSLAEMAHLILPGPAPFEREGTITNDQGRVQWLRPSLPLSKNGKADWEIIMEVMNTIGKRELDYMSVGEITREMGERFPAYEGVSLFRIGDQGFPINKVTEKE
jgi:NADH-quinone oxidoreductase subunit G